MSEPFRVLFVCMGNICRSPAAEIVFRRLVEEAGLAERIEVDSAGTTGYHTGNPPDPRMAATLTARGYSIQGQARRISPADLRYFDLILVADEENHADVRALDASGEFADKIRPLADFCKDRRVPRIPDPYYGGQRGFEEVADLVEDAGAGLLCHLRPRLSDS